MSIGIDKLAHVNTPALSDALLAHSAAEGTGVITIGDLPELLNAGNLKMPDSDETIAEHYRQFCNRTLLDNWYFANPVNQRGQMEYTGSGYTIDRWRSNNSTVVVSIMSGKIKLELSAKTIGWVFFQPIQKVANLVGKSGTVSAKIASFNTDHLKLIISARDSSDVEIATASASVENGIISATMLSVPKETVNFRVGIYAYDGSVAGEYVELEAMKLELGHRQTLAHKENNVWVLNEIPDYATELAKCQRYLRVFESPPNGYITANSKIFVSYIPALSGMRSNPAVVLENLSIALRLPSGYSPIASFEEPLQIIDNGYVSSTRFTFTSNETLGENNVPASVEFRSGRIIFSSEL